MANASLQPLYERLNGVSSYHPLSANTFTDWSMEAGDIVTIVRGDEEYSVPVHNSSLVWKGKQQISIESNGAKKRDPIARSSAKKYGRGGAAVRNSEYIFKEMYSEDGYLHSYVLMTESMLRTEFEAAVSGTAGQLYSAIEQTATYIMSDVTNVAENLHSEIIQTASYIIEHVGGANRKYTQWTAPTGTQDNPLREGDIWVKTNYTRTWDDAEGYTWDMLEQYTWDNLKGSSVYEYHDGSWKLILNEMELGKDADIIKTSDHVSIIAKDLKNTKDGLTGDVAELRVQANQIRSTVVDMRNDLGSAITQTASQIRTEVHAANSQLYSAIEQTATSIRAYVVDEVNDLGSEILQTASEIRAEVHASSSQLYSTISQTASAIRTEVGNAISGVNSTITQTASSIRSEVNAANSQVYSSITQTASSIRSEVASAISGVNSSITQTASQIRSEVTSAISGVNSSITQNANKIALVVETKSGNNVIKTASIVTAINGDSSVTISADRINLNGYVKATDITSDYINTKIASISDMTTGNIHAINVAGSDLKLLGADGQGHETQTSIKSSIKELDLSLSGNTYTLKKKSYSDSDWVTVGTFSRATSLSGNWSGDTLTITASPQGNDYSIGFTGSPTVKMGITTNGSASKHETLSAIVVPMKVCSIVGDNWTSRYTENITVTATNLSAGNIKKNVVIFGVTGTYEGTSRTDKGSGWYCTIEQSGSNKNCRLSKTFSASQNVPFSNGSSYHLYT